MSYNPLGDVNSGAWVLINKTVVDDQATVEFALSGSFKMYQVQIDDLVPSVDDRELRFRMSTDGGVTFISATSSYSYAFLGFVPGGTVDNDAVADHIVLSNTGASSNGNMGTGTIESLNGVVNIHNPNQATNTTLISTDITLYGSNATLANIQGYGNLILTVAAVDAVQFYANTGNLSTGSLSLYGLALS